MHGVSLPAIVRRYFSTRHFSFRGKRLPIKCAFYCEKRNREKESFFEVLSTWPWSAALKLSQWHLASLTKDKSFFSFLGNSGKKEKKGKWFQLSRNQCVSNLERFPVWGLADWLACMTHSDGGRQKSTFRGLNKVVLSTALQTKGPN